MSEEAVPRSYARRVGERLRAIRRQQGFSLHEVEAMSAHEFKASVLGAYERGERAISVPRLQRLARFYNVPVDQLLPQGADLDQAPGPGPGLRAAGVGRSGAAPPAADSIDKVTIDLTRLQGLDGADVAMLHRYTTMIQMQRQDFNGRVLSIRGDDLRTIACLMGTDVHRMVHRLDELGLRRTSVG